MSIKRINNRPFRRGALVVLAATVATVAAVASSGAKPAGQPKLVVGIIVEELQDEYLALLQDNFREGGLKRLMRDGVVIANVDFGAPIDATASTAIIYTGAPTWVNAIPSAEVMQRATLRPQPVFQDMDYMGNFTNQTLSPRALAVTTITDELKIAGGGITQAYAISPNPSMALIMGGHAGNCALWLNDANESWATTTYYKDVPSTLNVQNRLLPMRERIDTMTWTPMFKPEEYTFVPEHLKLFPFKYTFRQSGPDRMLQFRSSPKINDEVTNYTIENIKELSLGKHGSADMISLSYTVAPYPYSKNVDNRYETYDAYYQLDRNLDNLFSAIDQTVGLDNTLIFLAATPPAQRTRRDDEKWNLPYGEFSTKKAISLLNLYLIALYGNGEWVNAYHNGQMYLNQKLIEEKKQSLTDLRRETARFLERMAGVTKAYSLDEIIDSRSAETAPLRNATSLAHAGDVWLQVMPGWQIIDDFNNPKQRTELVERSAAASAPVYILAPNVTARKIEYPVDARAIAPTITSLLRIRSPNAASTPPLSLD
ncbi:MAG: alkaline phosphatase family protein [Bacteroidales bacterium]|nr:alkaline phosphatase family protein [Bacteroidales bacterium]